MSRYIPATAEERRRMLEYLGADSMDTLFRASQKRSGRKIRPGFRILSPNRRWSAT